MREKELGALGLKVNEKGQVIAKTTLLTEMEALVEEAGLKCCICLEGYKNQPAKVSLCVFWLASVWSRLNCSIILQLLGVYTFTRKVTLDEFETKPRKTPVTCTLAVNVQASVHCVLPLMYMYRVMQLFLTLTAFTMNVTLRLSSKRLLLSHSTITYIQTA